MWRPLQTLLLLPALLLAACNGLTTPNTLMTARPVAGSLAASQVSAGYGYACATATGGVYCWGGNRFGQLGDGTWDSTTAPVLVTGGHAVTQVAANADDHTCALDADGVAWCWGTNAYGDLGVPPDSIVMTNEPVRVATDQRFTQLVTGWVHSCGLTTGGEVYCWGSRGTTGVGPGNDDFDAIPPTRTLLDGTFVQISSQKWHTCALRDSGDLFCWGFSHAAELGGGEPYGYVDTPVQVSGGYQWVTVDVGALFTCALTADGAAYCWGRDYLGRLGLGQVNAGDVTAPAAVVGNHVFAGIVAGINHTCAWTADGAAYCWGNNEHGAVGVSGTGSVLEPTAVQADLTFIQLDAGEGFTCGIAADARIYCWGLYADAWSGQP